MFTDEFTKTTPKGLKTKEIKQSEEPALNEQCQTLDYGSVTPVVLNHFLENKSF